MKNGGVKIIGWTNVVSTFIQICIYLPWEPPQGVISTADWLDLAGSLFPLVPWAADVITLSAEEYQAKFIPSVGPGIIGVLGVVQLGIGIATAVEMKKDGDYKWNDEMGAVLTSFSPLAKLGTYFGSSGFEVAMVAGAVMMVLDTADDVVVPTVAFIGADERSS